MSLSFPHRQPSFHIAVACVNTIPSFQRLRVVGKKIRSSWKESMPMILFFTIDHESWKEEALEGEGEVSW